LPHPGLATSCGQFKTRAELLKDVVNAEQAVVAANKNSSDPAIIAKAQAAYDTAYLAYDPTFPQSFSRKKPAPGVTP
jgi:hypothetical protein